MSQSSSTTITFNDQDLHDEACVIVRRLGDNVALALSIRSNGDMEVVMDPATVSRLMDALQKVSRSE